MKMCLLGAELFHADQRTQKHNEANSWFSQFCQMCLKNAQTIGTASCMLAVIII
jgi:hypothetical protein